MFLGIHVPLLATSLYHAALYRLGEKWLESCFAEKDWRVLVDSQMNMSQQWVQTAKKATGMLASINYSGASRTRAVIIHPPVLGSGEATPQVLPSVLASNQKGH